VESFPQGGQRWKVSTNGGKIPVWSRNGRELYYYSPNDQLMAVELKPAVAGSTQSPFGVPKKLFEVQIGRVNPGYAVSQDGRFLVPVMAGQQEGPAPMTVVLNWPEMLKKK
jgi:hypothetical protein